MNPVISIIIPVYNVEKHIERCLNSILNQSFYNFELIVVNDGTKDKSMTVIEKYVAIDQRIKVINKSQNEGLMAARRTGYISAKGNYFVFCDSDDYLPPDAIKILYNKIHNSPYQIVLGSFTYVYNNGKKRPAQRSKATINSVEDAYKAIILKKMGCYICGGIYKRDIFSNPIETFINQTVNEDLLLMIQLLQYVNEINILDDSIYYYCQNLNSICNIEWSGAKLKQELFANNWSLSYLLNRGIFPQYAKRLYLRRLTLLLELGINRKNIFFSNEIGEKMYTFKNLYECCGIKYAIFAMLLYYSNISRFIARQGRRLIFKYLFSSLFIFTLIICSISF